MKLEQLFQELTGKEFPHELEAPVHDGEEVINPKKSRVLSMREMIEISLLSEKVLKNLFGKKEKPQKIKLQVNPKSEDYDNLTFEGDINYLAKHQVHQDLLFVKAKLARNGLRKLANGRIIVSDTINAPEFNFIVAGLYNPTTDTISISVEHAMENANYKWAFFHECGHRFDYRCGNSIPEGQNITLRHAMMAMYEYAKNHDGSIFPSEYAKKNSVEFWAVSFQEYYMGRLDDRLKTWVEFCINTYRSVCRF